MRRNTADVKMNEEQAAALEAEFTKVFNEHHGEIQAKLTAASQLIEEAVKLAEQHGIPFRPDEEIMFCRPSYFPASFDKKFKGLDWDFLYDLTEASGGQYDGWHLSQVC